MKNVMYGKTKVLISADNSVLGSNAAAVVAAQMRLLLAKQNTIRVVFAAGESQSSFLNALALEKEIDWKSVTCFNIDDFWDTRLPEKFTCAYQTTIELYRKVNPLKVNLVRYNAPDPEAECARFEILLREKPIDILCQGIGTSGHLALNEPVDTDFDDSKWVRLVDVAEQSKRQLIEDPNFKALGYIPSKGITMTIPAIMSARHCYTIVPLALKKPIMTRLADIKEPTNMLPASILLIKKGILLVDNDSCPDGWKF